MELWQYQGEPTQEEIIQREPYYKYDHLAIRPRCPNCNGKNTAWVRNEWSVCFSCIITFTAQDIAGCYDVQAYREDDRIPEEILEYI